MKNKKVNYAATIFIPGTQVPVRSRKGRIRIQPGEDTKSISDRIAAKHKWDLHKYEMELRLKNHAIKNKE